MDKIFSFFCTAPVFLEQLLAEELAFFGATSVKETKGGVSFEGSLETAYRVCLWSRIANRLFLEISTFDAGNREALYDAVQQIPWEMHLTADGCFKVRASLSQSGFNNSQFAALVVKDSVSDYFRSRYGKRPSVEILRPDVIINLHLQQDKATLSLDLSGESLHRRNYKEEGGIATLKENVAAAILLRGGWKEIAERGGAFVDPMCGTGTLLLEAACMAGDIAPGLFRDYFGFMGWEQHMPALWETLREEARGRREGGKGNIPVILGFDLDERSVALATENVRLSGLEPFVRIQRKGIDEISSAEIKALTPGLVAVNPPYGRRIGKEEDLPALYGKLGKVLSETFPGWRASLITADEELARNTGLKADKVNVLYNGPIKCTLAHFHLFTQKERTRLKEKERPPLSPGAEMFANRLKKNLKRLRKWAGKEGISSYRLYDSDMPEYNVSIDFFENRWVHVQEYVPPGTVDPKMAEARFREILSVLPSVLDVDRKNIFCKNRKRQKGKEQYQRINSSGEFLTMREGGNRFLINFTDHLDCGIFLDGRMTRELIRTLAKGKRFLNLFCYAGTATVYAAGGGAKTTTSVDHSNTYLSWAKENLALNGFSGGNHRFFKADCQAWLKENRELYDLIFLDPPTFSNSKTSRDFDIQTFHPELIKLAGSRLSKNGIILFSNNYRQFKMDSESLKEFVVEDISARTIPQDFSRSKHIHNCWRIARKDPDLQKKEATDISWNKILDEKPKEGPFLVRT